MGPRGAQNEPIWGSWGGLGAIFGPRPKKSTFRTLPGGLPEGSGRAPGAKRSSQEGSQERKKVVRDASYTVLGDHTARFQPKSLPKTPPRGPQEGPKRGPKLRRSKNEKSSPRLGGSMIFTLRRGPRRGPNGAKITNENKLREEIYENQLPEGSGRVPRATQVVKIALEPF